MSPSRNLRAFERVSSAPLGRLQRVTFARSNESSSRRPGDRRAPTRDRTSTPSGAKTHSWGGALALRSCGDGTTSFSRGGAEVNSLVRGDAPRPARRLVLGVARRPSVRAAMDTTSFSGGGAEEYSFVRGDAPRPARRLSQGGGAEELIFV